MLAEMVHQLIPDENIYHFMHPAKMDNENDIEYEIN